MTGVLVEDTLVDQGPDKDHNPMVMYEASQMGIPRGRFRRSSNGGDRVLRGRHGDNNQFYGRMHNWMSGNKRGRGNSPVFRRSRSRSPVPWNGGDRLSHPHDEFSRGEDDGEHEVFFPGTVLKIKK
ncbi:hypothetical protein Bca52824_058039 [Brassica carinata]|uniref:Uncharacterized protein n=1 Tax=Brassica carinata TaxID=52824 RepID=A0A8X7QYJ2_BRACI|nr:hypothetical protein Bca52824_058039 [Brassica carinata]